MNKKIVHSAAGITIIGGGKVSKRQIGRALALAPCLVAADGGLRHLRKLGLTPKAVIGDFDSAKARDLKGFAPDLFFKIREQTSTDFEKCLYSVSAPFVIALGVTGSRLDHGLSALNVLSRYPQMPVVLMGGKDIVFLCPNHLKLDLPIGTRVSLFPLAQVQGKSQGLEWPIDALLFSPDGQIGTSNKTNLPQVDLKFDQRKMLVILPRRHLNAVLTALLPAD